MNCNWYRVLKAASRRLRGSNGVALGLRVGDVGINIADSDVGGHFVGPGEEMASAIHRLRKCSFPPTKKRAHPMLQRVC